MLPLLEGSKQAIYDSDEFVGGEMGGGRWMRQGDIKAVLIPKPYGPGVWQLFDVANDPGESKDLSKQMPKKLTALKAAWDEYAAEVGVVLPVAD
jgi:arylsulfatase